MWLISISDHEQTENLACHFMYGTSWPCGLVHFFRALNSAEGLGSNDARSVKLSYRAEIILRLWGLLQFPWGMHICHYDEGKKKEPGLVCMASHIKRTLEIGMGVKFKFIFKILDLTIFFKCCFERYMYVDFNKIP